MFGNLVDGYVGIVFVSFFRLSFTSLIQIFDNLFLFFTPSFWATYLLSMFFLSILPKREYYNSIIYITSSPSFFFSILWKKMKPNQQIKKSKNITIYIKISNQIQRNQNNINNAACIRIVWIIKTKKPNHPYFFHTPLLSFYFTPIFTWYNIAWSCKCLVSKIKIIMTPYFNLYILLVIWIWKRLKKTREKSEDCIITHTA
jgi:hypothetical protein